jgi:hypothetical protein
MNSLTSPSARFQSEIEPAWNEYLSDSLVERKANNLARAIDHHLDWTFTYYDQVDRSRLMGATNLEGFRQKLFGLCPELKMMRDLSDAAHHRFLRRSSAVVVTSSAAYSVQNGALLVPDYGGAFGDSARKTVEFWRQWPD